MRRLMLVVLTLVVVALAVGSSLSPFDPNAFHYDSVLKGPDSSFWLGTDNYGRDVMSRTLHGARESLLISFSAVVLGSIAGTALGLWGGYVGGVMDGIIQRMLELVLTFPAIVLAIGLVAVLGPSVQNVIVVVAVTQTPLVGRVVRSSVLAIKEEAYIEAARVAGVSTLRVLLRHVLPNAVAPLIVVATLGLGTAILVEASISFLGLGPPPPNATLGNMLSGDARQYGLSAPWMVLFPGLALAVMIMAFNALGDALREELDPKLRSREAEL